LFPQSTALLGWHHQPSFWHSAKKHVSISSSKHQQDHRVSRQKLVPKRPLRRSNTTTLHSLATTTRTSTRGRSISSILRTYLIVYWMKFSFVAPERFNLLLPSLTCPYFVFQALHSSSAFGNTRFHGGGHLGREQYVNGLGWQYPFSLFLFILSIHSRSFLGCIYLFTPWAFCAYNFRPLWRWAGELADSVRRRRCCIYGGCTLYHVSENDNKMKGCSN